MRGLSSVLGGKLNLCITSGQRTSESRNPLNKRTKAGPLLQTKDHHRNSPPRKVLLIAHVLVGGQQDIESFRLSSRQQLTILELFPALLRRGAHFMIGKIGANRDRSGLIEQNAHVAFYSRLIYANLGSERWCLVQAACGKLDHCLHLFAIETVVPLHDLVDTGSRVQSLEDRGDMHTRCL